MRINDSKYDENERKNGTNEIAKDAKNERYISTDVRGRIKER